MTKNSLVDGIYLARDPRRSAPQAGPRLGMGTALIVMLLLSLGSWWAIWKAVSSLVLG
jgi:hypothetical protein